METINNRKAINFISFFILFSGLNFAQAQIRPALSPTPPMGWNSWNYFGKHDINEGTVREIIDAMVSSGLRDAGYRYVVIDGGWRDVKLAPDGRLLPHPEKFPNGIKPLADYAHANGLKLGLHIVPGTHDCGGDPVGGYGNEEVQTKQFVDWGVDFIKLDKCKMKGNACDTCMVDRNGWDEDLVKKTYVRWSELLYHCGREILFSVSAYKFRSWNPEYCNMSRTTYDILSKRNSGGAVFNDNNRDNSRSFLSVMGCAEINDESAAYAGNGYWNDPDMLVTGSQGLTKDEEVSHFALWAIINAPLFLGNDPRNMSELERTLLLNREIIAINQDSSSQGKLVVKKPTYQIWQKKMSDGSTSLLLLNLSNRPSKITVDFEKLQLPELLSVRDVINKQDAGTARGKFTKRLAVHACALIRVEEPHSATSNSVTE